MTPWTNWRKCATSFVAVVTLSTGVSLLGGALGQAGASVASAGGAVNTYRLSGGVSGTLHDGPEAGCPYGGINSKGFIELNDLVGSVSGLKDVASFNLDANVKKNGTFKFKAFAPGDPNAELSVALKNGSIAQGVKDTFFARSGTITVKGESGSITASLSQTAGKSMKLVARWDCGAAAAASELSGPGWKTPVLVNHAKPAANFTSVSCPTTTVCVAVNEQGSAFTLQGTTWSGPVSVDTGSQSNPNDTMGTVSCASASFCVAGDDLNDVFTYNGTSWSGADQLDAAAASPSVSFSVSCPTTTFCLAVDGDYNYFTYNGSTWTQAQVIDSTTLLGIVIGEVSCASPTFCLAAFGDKTVTFNGTSWSAPVTIATAAELKSGANPSLEALSCPSPTFCAGAGTTPDNVGYLSTFNGSSWSKPVTKKTNLGPQAFVSVSCPLSSFCMAPGLDGWVTYNGSSWSSPQTFSDPGGPIGQGPEYANSISCASPKVCEEVESLGYVDAWKG